MPERCTTLRPWPSPDAVARRWRPDRCAAGRLRCNPPRRHSMAPMSSAERMRLLRQRRAQGETSPRCKACGSPWQPRMASFARLQAGLCSGCWRKTAEGKEEDRERDRRRNATQARRAATAERVRRYRARKRGEPAGPGANAVIKLVDKIHHEG